MNTLPMLTYNKENKTFKFTLGEDSDDVIIGNQVRANKFEADLRLSCWKNENSLSIAYENFTATPAMQGNKITLSKGKEAVFFYKASNSQVKFGLILKEKPPRDQWHFKLTGWEEFNFFYQHELTSKDIIQGAIRPPEVVGSYAVYHKSKKNYIRGKVNYRTGKAFHIYRPKFTDSIGSFVWGDLHIEKGIYTVKIPQTFLDSAKYPITANDTFGYTNEGGSSTNLNWNALHGFYPYSPATDGVLTNMRFYGGANPYEGGTFACGLYKTDDSYVGCTVVDTMDDEIKWWIVNASGTVNVYSATNYVLAVWATLSGLFTFHFDDNVASGKYRGFNSIDYNYPNWPNPGLLIDGYEEDRQYSIYCTFEPVAGNPYPVPWLKKKLKTGYNCFMNAYLKAKILSYDPLKLPDGTIF